VKGLLLYESLADISVLELLRITKTETWQVSNAAAYQPKIWTALSFEADDHQDDDIAEALSKALKTHGWYIDATTETSVYVIFPSKVFKYLKGAYSQREAAKEYARSIGIPESQLDWAE
jgi:hypothetical protein